MSIQGKTNRSKTRLKADVVMSLFLHEMLAIRNLTKHIQELIGNWHKNLVASIGQANLSRRIMTKYLTYCLNPSFGGNSLRKPDLNSSVI